MIQELINHFVPECSHQHCYPPFHPEGDTKYLIKRVLYSDVEPVGTPGLLWIHKDPVSRCTVYLLWQNGLWYNLLGMFGAGGDSNITWHQIVTSGTKIATITIGNETTDVYAPTGGGGGGSNVEVKNTLQNGTRIATITIDGVDHDVYIPSNLLTDANSDGRIYGRKNGQWVEVEGGITGRGIVSITEYYQAGNSNITPPTGEWVEDSTPPDYGNAKPYLWNKTLTIYTDGTQEWRGPVCIASWGTKGNDGDIIDTVYALANTEKPVTVTVKDNTEAHQEDDYTAVFVFNLVDSDSYEKTCTRSISSISETNRYRYKSTRVKHNGVWGVFSTPALDANWTSVSLSPEQIEEIRDSVQEAIEEDLTEALARILTLEAEFDDIENDLGGIFETINEQTGRLEVLEARTVYTDEDIARIADVEINAQKGTIEAWAAQKTEDMFTDAGITINGVAATVEAFADFYDEEGTLSTVHSRLDAVEGIAETAVTTSDLDGAISSARTEWQAGDNLAITQSVTKAHYLMDNEGYLLDTDGEYIYIGTRRAKYPEDIAYGITVVEGMSFIKQSAGEIALATFLDDPSKAAQIVLAANESGTNIELNADHIRLVGQTEIDEAAIENLKIKDCTITECEILSSIKSDDYDDTGEGFYLNAETGEVIATKFGEANNKGFTIAGGHIESYQKAGSGRYEIDYNPVDIDADGIITLHRLVGSPAQPKGITLDPLDGIELDGCDLRVIANGNIYVGNNQVVTSPLNNVMYIVHGAPPVSGANQYTLYIET